MLLMNEYQIVGLRRNVAKHSTTSCSATYLILLESNYVSWVIGMVDHVVW